MEFLDQLQNPPREFTAIPFWFLNGDLTAEELRRQLADFAAHGIYGVVLHPRMGLSPDITYLGERYFAHIRTAVEAAAALDMKIVLYDEGMYPSGSACGLVVKDHPELASEGITLTQTVLPGDELLAQTESGALVVRKSGGTMRGLHWGEDDGEANAPKTADILNPAAVSRFIELTHEAYYRELKEYFGAAIIGFFTDEPSILGRNVSGMLPWTHGFAEIFRRAGGNAANLAALFNGRENDDTRLYHKLLLQREGEVYYGTLSRWCKAHGIGLMGHPHQSDDIEVEKYFAVPGQDLVLRWLAPEKDGLAGIDSTMAKCSADAARLMHRRRNSNECFGACNKDDNPWQLSGGDIKWYTDWLAVRGVNLFIPHAFYYSICGKRKDERPPDVGPHSIWWAHYEAWSTYWRRLSWLMTDIDLHAETAVLCRNRDLCPDTVRPLFERQIGFQYIPESCFPACTVEDGALCLHGHRYTAVLGDKALFPDAAHPEVSALEPDCRCDPPQPMLRCAYFNKEGRACWLLVNEGNTPIKTRLTLPVDAPLCRYDLWSGQPCACPAERTAKGACLPPEFGADDPRRHRHIERFRTPPVGRVRRDEQFAGDGRGRGVRNAAPLVAHDDDPRLRERCPVDVLPLQESPAHRQPGVRGSAQEPSQVGVVHPHAEYGAHRGLHDLGVETVGRRLGADHVADAEPVGQPDDRPQIARVLHVVERQHQRSAQLCGIESAAGDLDEGQRVGRGFQQREPFHLFRRDRRDVLACENAVERIDAADAERRGAQFADEFPAFGDEKPLVGAGAFVRQRADESDVGFGQHLKGRFSIVKVRPSSARSLAGKSVRASSSSGASSL